MTNVKVYVCFSQKRWVSGDDSVRALTKHIELAALPMPGCSFEYQDGWGLAMIDNGLSVYITAKEVSIEGYGGPQFSDEEIASLVALGWEATR